MTMIESCVFCTTPYQIIAALVIAKMQTGKCDLYIVPEFFDARGVADRLQNEKVFNRIKVVDEDSPKHKYTGKPGNRFQRQRMVFAYLHVEKIANSTLWNDTEYRYYYCSSKAFLSRIIYLYFCRHYPKMQFTFFDDGEGSYTKNITYLPSKADRVIRKIIFGKRSLKPDQLMLYSPELYRHLNQTSTIICEQLPLMFDTLGGAQKAKDLLNRVFGYDPPPTKDVSVLIIDTIWDETLTEKGKLQIEQLYRIMIEKYGAENIQIKRHPRDKTSSILGVKEYISRTIPLECLCCNIDLNRFLIVSPRSTAISTPKLIFHQEPVVVLLDNLVEHRINTSERVLKYYQAVKELYSDKNRFLIPSSIDDFVLALEHAYTILEENN